MNLPIKYFANFVENPDETLMALQSELDWERREDAPRCEYYCNDFSADYIYGKGRGQRTYTPKPWHAEILKIRTKLEDYLQCKMDVCFLNRYLNQSDHLGWHADDSPEMDDDRPIVTISLGVEREIWFRPLLGQQCTSCGTPLNSGHKMSCYVDKYKTTYGNVEKLKLEHGSMCIMEPGMQDTWQHRIPKASFQCGERISLTFRGYVENVKNIK